MAITLDGTSGINTPGVTNTGNDTISGNVTISGSLNTPNTFGFKNRIINGAMVIDQRNAGASISNNTSGSQFSLDRWLIYGSQASKFNIQQNAGSVTPPIGFTNYLGCTSTSAYTVTSSDEFVVIQRIEGLNVADLGWGTANAATITLSFWVRSSLTGTFGGMVGNSALSRRYIFSYTISAANTWEQKTVTIAGDTTGTWLATNGIGLQIYFSIGAGTSNQGTPGVWGTSFIAPTGQTSVVGTNGATFYITGVQLEKGSTATSFDFRSYSSELAMCQRYFCLLSGGGACGVAESTTRVALAYQYPVPMRAAPIGTLDATKGTLNSPSTGVNNVTTMNNFFFGTAASETGGFLVLDTSTASWIASRVIINAGTTGMIRFSAEL